MDKARKARAPAAPLPTDGELDAAAQALGRNWARSVARSGAAARSEVVQRLTGGRSHAVTVEIKRSPRRLGGPR